MDLHLLLVAVVVYLHLLLHLLLVVVAVAVAVDLHLLLVVVSVDLHLVVAMDCLEQVEVLGCVSRHVHIFKHLPVNLFVCVWNPHPWAYLL